MAKSAPKKILVGLGNPDPQYANTYHNVGRIALEKIARGSETGASRAFPWEKHKNLFEYLETDRAIFVRPLTYMNESGKAVREALKKFSSSPASLSSRLFVLHDDSDITIGNYKISFARNSAGHKGVQSVIDAVKTKEFSRIRIGIRPAREVKRQKAGEFALKTISPSHQKVLDAVFEKLNVIWNV
jgi:PTH1 family peptidyl-tRNA hydrolase